MITISVSSINHDQLFSLHFNTSDKEINDHPVKNCKKKRFRFIHERSLFFFPVKVHLLKSVGVNPINEI